MHGSLIRSFQVPTHSLHHVALIIRLIRPKIMDDIIVLATCLVSSDTVVNRNRGIERPTSAGDRDLIARPTIRWAWWVPHQHACTY
jgi:hypothetical protein